LFDDILCLQIVIVYDLHSTESTYFGEWWGILRILFCSTHDAYFGKWWGT